MDMQVRVGVHTDMAVMKHLSLGRAKYFFLSIEDAFRYVNVKAFRLKTNGKASELLKRHVLLVEQQTQIFVREIVLYGWKESSKESRYVPANGTDIYPTAAFTCQKDV